MCGIIGYQGPQNTKKILLNSLEALEYRGYDSVGIAIFDKGRIQQRHAQGPLASLKKEVKDIQFDGSLGIGHTRWATHGVPSKKNAHPHYADGFSIVHNGIIENHIQLRKHILESGSKILSETDSELIAHLLSMAFKKTGDLLQAVQQTMTDLKGAYCVLAINEREPETWLAFKFGPPLVLGISPSEIFVASDIQPIIPHTDKIVYLQDNEIVKIQKTKYQIFHLKGLPIERKPIALSNKKEAINKKGYPHFMLKEIFEQSESIQRVLAPFLDPSHHKIHFDHLKSDVKRQMKEAQRIFIIACGSSYYAGLALQYLIERWAEIPVDVELASEFRYRDPVISSSNLYLFISQSGETADTLAALRLVKQKGGSTLAICNVPYSTIDREAHACIDMSAGIEVSVASTKAFTNTLAIGNVLAFGLQRLSHHASQKYLHCEADFCKALKLLPTQIQQVLYFSLIFKKMAQQIKESQNVLFMGRGLSFPIALEGALKLKELAYLHVEGYAAGEMKHGPIALVDHNTSIVVLVPKNDLYEKTKNNLEEVRVRGGKIIEVTTRSDQDLREKQANDFADCGIYPILPKAHWATGLILETVIVQMVAYSVACLLGHNVDRPRNLAKSVTVE